MKIAMGCSSWKSGFDPYPLLKKFLLLTMFADSTPAVNSFAETIGVISTPAVKSFAETIGVILPINLSLPQPSL